MLALFLSLAHAGSLLVFPLEQGDGSERHKGLGFALADLVEVDLAEMPGIDLETPDDRLESVSLNRNDGVSLEDVARAVREREIDWALRGTWRMKDHTLSLADLGKIPLFRSFDRNRRLLDGAGGWRPVSV
ncbi:MAG: hypothetical protein R3F61_31655 [Myxococcota bacterium]